jgi:hypothetical protein
LISIKGGLEMRFRFVVFCVAVLLAAATFGRSANAVLLQYEVGGPYNYSFTLDSTSVFTADPDFGGFFLTNVANSSGSPFEYLYFIDLSNSGGIAAYHPDSTPYFDLTGQPLFSGSLDAPTLLTGSFSLISYGLDEPPVTVLVTPIPEPSTWAMMILGFAGVAFMAYRRRKVAALAP